MAKEKKYTITCTKEQLKMISLAVEDWHRFLAGQCEMSNAMTCLMRNGNTRKIMEILSQQVKPIVTPYLPFNASYSWDGALCPNIDQRKAIAMSYGIYRQIEHFFALQRNDNDWNVHHSPTLTCEEQGGLIEVKEV